MKLTIDQLKKNVRENACNNYRKMHGLPMRRWKWEWKHASMKKG